MMHDTVSTMTRWDAIGTMAGFRTLLEYQRIARSVTLNAWAVHEFNG
jgi:hypothetical protein